MRESSMCLQSYKGYPEFKIKGSGEEFIAKVCLIIDECPAPLCPQGCHKKIPAQCLSWWKEVGCKAVKWRGVNSESSSSDIKEKMRMFRKNYNRRQGGADLTSQASNTSLGPGEEHNLIAGDRDASGQDDNSGTQCAFCDFSGSLAEHLQMATCLDHYKKSHLPRRFWHESERKIIFDLSLSLCPSFCPNPACSVTHLSGGAIAHLNQPCSSFIMSEIVAVYGCDTKGSIEVAVGKLKRRQSYLREVFRDESQLSGPGILRKEVSHMMTAICSTCLIQGPMVDGKEYEMEECTGTLPTRWQCKRCSASQERQHHIMQEAVENVGRLSNLRSDCTMEAVKVNESGDPKSRIVFMPKIFANNPSLQEEGQIVDPKRTTVLVPRHPDALDVFGEEAIEEAFKARHELKKWAEFISKRIIFTNLNVAVTLLEEKKLADIKESRVTMLTSMKTSSKGVVLSRDPNVGDIKERNPHYDATKMFCLTDTCPWSDGHMQQKSEESAAIAWTNGQLKTKVKIEVTNLDCPELRNIISIAKDYYGDRITGMLPLAPLVLQFATGKVKLVIKHLVSKLYDNWDLQVSFEKSDWGVELSGFLYSAQYDAINKKMAGNAASLSEIIEAVTQQPEVQPTASLDPGLIADCYGIREDAEVGLRIIL